MADFDLVIRGGRVVTAGDSVICDVGVKDGRVAALGESLAAGSQEVDARGLLVMPGGVDSHCHIDQEGGAGVTCATDFQAGTVSAAIGGTTTIIPFAAQKKGQSLREAVKAYHALAEPKAVCDYAFHLILTDPTEQVLGQELPALIKDGYTSFKVYMTYDALKVDDRQLLDILALARHEQAMVMVHAENHEVIGWMTDRLLAGGHVEPRYHAVAHARLAEGEATHRAICLAELLDTPLLIVHVSAPEAIDQIARAQSRGLKIYGETCPQYLFLTADDLNRDGMEGAKYCCSPPPRDAAGQEAVWHGLATGTFQVFSSDHAPYRFDETGKLAAGPKASFDKIANGVPGLAIRLPLLFSEGVGKGRIDINQFVQLTASNAARLYGLYPRKGTIAVGADADIAIWDPKKEVTITWEMLQDDVGYSPYEGRQVTGWPIKVYSRGRLAMEDGQVLVGPGSGEFLRCELPETARALGRSAPELDPARNFGAALQG